ncbi:MAG: HlyC/CorC family transporter [Rhodospirillaceae bacterium]|nr:HlyC/CorC family transporter [Rhodospirillaceae bacterium]MBT4491573.1 HlyC/CorC family transporter [Rhodospirillaceae bacterium]MBT5896921.1 HlyC/CorC family transporter [Rhodospirillaceae bacterium]MBT6429025.1 HlyC/CorC family transporter [Rhodospirillaceae bacterium]MBT7759755.1 HlyC/CorC family transporter [Rhodospirillaceae bacterium]
MNEISDPNQPHGPRGGGAKTEAEGGGFLNWLSGLLRGGGDADLRESIEEVIDEHEASPNSLNPEQREMLMNIISFGELEVDDVMVPRTDIVALEAGASPADVVSTFRQAHHSRLPVFRETLDDIAGFVHIKDVVDHWGRDEELSLARILRELLVVPPSMPILDLLARMRATRIHMAVVVDEYGGTDGLVTIEDIVEEIVGEIEDEHDKDDGPTLEKLPDGSIDADGRAEIEDLEEILAVDLLPDEADEDIDTLGGLVFAMLGRVPRVGEVISHPVGINFEIVDADLRRVKRLLVRPGAPLAADGDGNGNGDDENSNPASDAGG